MPPELLLTRPEEASRRFAAELAPLGLRITISPALRIVPVPHDGAALGAARGLVFTSVHAVPAAGPGRGRPAYCVGPATAETARAAGYVVTDGGGDAAHLAPMLEGLGPGWLHPHGTHIARKLPVPGMVVYDQVPVEPLPEALALLAGVTPVIVPVFSPRSAALVSGWRTAGGGAPVLLAAISDNARVAWRASVAGLAIAPTPDAPGMRVAIERLAQAAPDHRRRLEASGSDD